MAEPLVEDIKGCPAGLLAREEKGTDTYKVRSEGGFRRLPEALQKMSWRLLKGSKGAGGLGPNGERVEDFVYTRDQIVGSGGSPWELIRRGVLVAVDAPEPERLGYEEAAAMIVAGAPEGGEMEVMREALEAARSERSAREHPIVARLPATVSATGLSEAFGSVMPMREDVVLAAIEGKRGVLMSWAIGWASGFLARARREAEAGTVRLGAEAHAALVAYFKRLTPPEHRQELSALILAGPASGPALDVFLTDLMEARVREWVDASARVGGAREIPDHPGPSAPEALEGLAGLVRRLVREELEAAASAPKGKAKR